MLFVFRNGNLLHHRVIWGRFQSVHQRLEVSCIVQVLRLVWVEVSNLADVLSALRVTASINESTVAPGVLDNLDCHEIGLEFKKVTHHSSGNTIKLFRAEVIEFV